MRFKQLQLLYPALQLRILSANIDSEGHLRENWPKPHVADAVLSTAVVATEVHFMKDSDFLDYW